MSVGDGDHTFFRVSLNVGLLHAAAHRMLCESQDAIHGCCLHWRPQIWLSDSPDAVIDLRNPPREMIILVGIRWIL